MNGLMMFGLLSQKRIPNSQALKGQNAELIDGWVAWYSNKLHY